MTEKMTNSMANCVRLLAENSCQDLDWRIETAIKAIKMDCFNKEGRFVYDKFYNYFGEDVSKHFPRLVKAIQKMNMDTLT